MVECDTCNIEVAGSNPVGGFLNTQRNMKINLWYCKDMNLWRWTLTDNSRTLIKQESGQQPDLRMAMNDVANTVEYLLSKR